MTYLTLWMNSINKKENDDVKIAAAEKSGSKQTLSLGNLHPIQDGDDNCEVTYYSLMSFSGDSRYFTSFKCVH